MYEEQCGDQEYQCDDLSCINQDSVCDGTVDCPHMEDEVDCGESTDSVDKAQQQTVAQLHFGRQHNGLYGNCD